MTYDAVVLGAGGWGTALATLLAANGHRVGLWARRPEFAEELRLVRENRPYLPGVALPAGVEPGHDLAAMLPGARLVVVAAPSHGLREVARRSAPHLARGIILVSATKGLERETDLRMSQVLGQELGAKAERLAVVSGPNFSAEVGRSQPTATVVASPSRQVAEAVQDALMGERFRVYTNPDVVGVELCGALKNVYAIAVGVSDGLGLGNNTRAAVITRALAEMTRLGAAVGAQPMTFAGLAGLGDLVLTCTGDLSRNRRAGLRLGRGEPVAAVTDGGGMVIEGVRTAAAACSLARRVGVELPIAEQVVAVLKGKPPAEAVGDLMTRDRRHEIEEVVSPPLDWKP